MIVEDRAKKERTSVWARTMLLIPVGEAEKFFCIISFRPSFDLFVRSGLPVLIDLIVGDKMVRLM